MLSLRRLSWMARYSDPILVSAVITIPTPISMKTAVATRDVSDVG